MENNKYKPPAIAYKSKSLVVVLIALFFRLIEFIAESLAVSGRIIDFAFGFISKTANKCANWLLSHE